MFVTCDSCHAEYEIDDAKIPAGGARLRCTGCNHSFVVRPPEVSDRDAAEALAHEAVSAQSAVEEPVEAAEADFDDAGADFEFGAVEAAPPVSEPVPDTPAVADEFVSDWEFNDAIEDPSATKFADPDFDASESAEDAVDDLLGASGSVGEDAEDAVDGLLGASGPVGEDAEDAVDDLLGEIGSDDLSLDANLDADFSVAAPDDASDAFGESFDLAGPDASGDLGSEPAAAASAPVDDSDWNLFDEAAEAPAAPRPQRRPRSRAGSAAHAEPNVGMSVALATDSSVGRRWNDRAGEVAGWAVVAMLSALALVGGLSSNSRESRAPYGTWSGAGFEVDQVASRWVENAAAGPIYVISGRVRRAAAAPSEVGSGLEIRLLDESGVELALPRIVPLAPAVPERVLRESTPGELESYQLSHASRVAGVGSGWVPFEAVLVDLPETAARFEMRPRTR